MSNKYFDKFPTITYNGLQCIDITKRAGILNTIYSDPNLYYFYDIKQGERPDNLAYKYYKDPYMDWSLFIVNKRNDPYYQWYLDTNEFQDILASKYGSLQNAISKTKFYRNNWYENTDPISLSTYDALPSNLKDYYEPNYSSNSQYGITSLTPINYVRKHDDLIVTTNQIASFTCNTTPNTFIVDEIVTINYNSGNTGKGQILSYSNTLMYVQHLSGSAISSGNGYLYGTESLINVSFSTSASIANNIPDTESTYWSPVTYYDYENELNENNKSIQILKSSYQSQIVNDLTNLMSE